MQNRRKLIAEHLEPRQLLTITVDTLVDELDGSIENGDVSLRDAIAAAADGEVIDFAAGLSGTILLDPSLGELFVDKPLTIDGPGSEVLALDGRSGPEQSQGHSGVLRVDDGDAESLLEATISGLTVSGGRDDDFAERGGGIFNAENLTLRASNISGNSVPGPFSGAGGGIYSTGVLTIIDSSIVNNTAAKGGGIWSRGELTIEGSEIRGNHSYRGSAGIASDGSLVIRRSTISGNAVIGIYGGSAGGIASGGTTVIEDSSIRGNSVYGCGNYPAWGGGLSVSGNLTVTRSVISGNQVSSENGDPEGGGLSVSGNLTVTGSVISGNQVSTYVGYAEGGGVNHGGGSLTISNSTVAANHAIVDIFDGAVGGGIVTSGNLTVISSTIAGNTATSSDGGISASGPQVTIKNSIVAGNSHGEVPSDIRISETGTLRVDYSLLGTNVGTTLGEAPIGAPDSQGNLVGGSVHGTIDPLLGPLDDNGGLTETHALLPGSPAIDAGDPAAMAGVDGVPLYDQRGEPFARVASADSAARIDIGAYERQNLTVDLLDVASPTDTPIDAVTILFTRPVSGFDLADLVLSRNAGDNLLTSDQSLTTADNRMFVLGGLADVTTLAGYYTLRIIFPGSGIVDTGGGPLDSGDDMSWAMGRSELGLTVDTLVDEVDGRIDDGDISLRDAIAAAAPGETIDFDSSLDGGTILLTHGELLLTRPLTIDGATLPLGLVIDAAGNDPTPSQDDGQGSRIFHVDDGDFGNQIAVEISGLTLTGGDVSGDGGAIYNRENLTITSSTLSGNSASGYYAGHGGRIYNAGDGGGISNFGWATVTSSTISGNSATSGGGIYNSGTVAVTSSTLSGNSASGHYAVHGGGISNFGKATLTGSTISGNSARSGGGIYNSYFGTATVTSSTLSGNSARFGGGISSFGTATITITSSIVAGNIAPIGAEILSEISTVDLNNYNLLGDGSKTTAEAFNGVTPGGTDMTATSDGTHPTALTSILDTMLADNGGPTLTHALLPGSPAINAGDPTAIAGVDGIPLYDQRGEGFDRVVGGRIDMGAFEVQVEGLAADFDKDGDVDGADFLVWQTNFFTPTGATPNDGDADQDGDVDGEDFLIWQLEFAGESAGAGANRPDASVDLPGRHRPDQLLWRLTPGQDHKEASARAAIQDEVLAQLTSSGPSVEWAADPGQKEHPSPTRTCRTLCPGRSQRR